VPDPGSHARALELRRLQQITLAGMRNVGAPLDLEGNASPLGRGDWDVTRRTSEDDRGGS
jgi:hypothetical protein